MSDNVVDIADVPLTKREKLDLYCEGLANGLTKEKAYIAAGYSPNGARKNASIYHRTNHEYIQVWMSEHIGSHAPTALKVLLKIMNDESEKGGIRLKAAQDVLDRAGFSAKQKIEVTTPEVRDMSTEDLQNELKRAFQDQPELAKIFDFNTHPSRKAGETP